MRYGRLALIVAGSMVPAAAQAGTPKPVVPARPAGTAPAITALEVQPASLTFTDRRDSRKLVVLGRTAAGGRVDLTPIARFETGSLVKREADGFLAPLNVGSGFFTVRVAGKTARVPVAVKSLAEPPVSFVRDVEPVLNKAGCNQGTCHGAAKGKNGFKLSLRGYDPDFDYHSLVDDVGGRRFNRAAPEQSLMLLKAIQEVPHQGGLVFDRGSRRYEIIRRWIAEGVKSDVGKTARVNSLEVLPKNPTLPLPGAKQSLVVIARYPDGTTRDVTRDARFTSSVAEVAEVDDRGTVKAVRRGESAILVAYEGQFATSEFTVLGDRTGYRWVAQPQHNFIDQLIDEKLKRIRALPAPLCTDDEFIRRVTLDLTGLLPTPEAVREFLADSRASRVKREALTDRLLSSPEFDEHWTYKLADLLQVNRKYLGDKGVAAFRSWIHGEVARNRPYDEFVREILTASGSAYGSPAANYFRVVRDTGVAAENVTQLFLGVRFSCNKCHDHPFERWTQAQYYQLGAYFARVGYKAGEAGDEQVFDRADGEVIFPRTGQPMAPAFPVSFPGAKPEAPNRREALADWITSPSNPFFAKSTANRFWSYFMGRGIIDPVDDIRGSNPPSNAPLLERLTADFVASGFDLRHLMRTIVRSRSYQSSIATNRWNEDDPINFSHQVPRRLTAEQLLDAISLATGSPQRYPGVPLGTHAKALPDTQVASGGFLDLFGRPARESPCECERTSEVSLAQALNLMNGETIANAIADPSGRVARLVREQPDDGKLIEEIYLAAMSRPPKPAEATAALKHFKDGMSRPEAAQDLMWALINSPAFLFNR